MFNNNHEENLNSAVKKSIVSLKNKNQNILRPTVSLEDEIEEIKATYETILNIDKGLMDVRVRFWRKLGDALREHKKHVLKARYKWEAWAAEHFRAIGGTRRQQCMLISRYGNSLEKYYYLGFDRIYYFANTMVRSQKDPELKEIANRFGINFNIERKNIDHRKFMLALDKMKEYFSFKLKMKGIQYDKKLVLDAIDTGVSFSKLDYEALKNNQIDQSEYLMAMILNCGSPKSKAGSDKKESTIVLLAKLSENLDVYISNNTIPQYLSKGTVRRVLLKLAHLYKKLP
jgi:hypothetical protein